MKTVIYSFKFWFVALTCIIGGTILDVFLNNTPVLTSLGYVLTINGLVWSGIYVFFRILCIKTVGKKGTSMVKW